MNTISPDDDFYKEITCTYKDQRYTVRDNGAILRHPRKNGRLSSNDNRWTFGKLNCTTGYLEIAAARVHRIVAFAFHGEPPSKEHVVDHIDTNKQNNRLENLRWVTRFENVLLNPITVKRIESICKCNIEEFVTNPQKYRDLLSNAPKDIQWMRTVSKEEAQESLKNLTYWAKTDKPLLGKSLGEWIFYRNDVHSKERIEDIFKQVKKRTRISRQELCFNKAKRGDHYEARKYAAKLLRSELNLSDYEIGNLIGISANTVNMYLELTEDIYSGDYEQIKERELQKRLARTQQNFIQKNWAGSTIFPCCPNFISNDPITEYSAQIDSNKIFFQTLYYFTTVIQSAIIDKGKSLLVMYKITKKENPTERWGIMKITFENNKFEYEIILNYNGTLEHYWLVDVRNHFNSIVEGTDWYPLYDSNGNEFKGGYMPF